MNQNPTSLEKVLSIIDNQGHHIEGVTETTILDGYIDSLDLGEIVFEIERRLNTQIADDEVENWQTVGDIVATYDLFNRQNSN